MATVRNPDRLLERLHQELIREDLKMGPGARGALKSFPLDEPIFILRAQDIFAPLALAAWIDNASSVGTRQEKIDEARDVYEAMMAWPKKKLPD